MGTIRVDFCFVSQLVVTPLSECCSRSQPCKRTNAASEFHRSQETHGVGITLNMQTRSYRERERACIYEEEMWNSAKHFTYIEFSVDSFKTAMICRIFSFLASFYPFKWLLRALMALLEQR